MYFLLEYLVFVYKRYQLIYPNGVLAVELVGVSFFLFAQFTRINFGSSGNKTESSQDLIFFILLSIPCIIAFIFFLRVQTYTLLFEVVLNAFGLFFSGFEFIFAIVAMASFGKADKGI
mmetsp:Transcript_30051/g.27467  ORF Transcript_30051/g.27467 Transcript_30051/m.27467 type:complete len:118 (+) Transcript_30051:423-776(+)